MDSRIYIFGAHSRGRTLAKYLCSLYSNLIIEAFLYDNDEKNPALLEEAPVIFLDDMISLHTENAVYIGTRGVYHEAITKKLWDIGFTKIYPVTVELDLKLRNRYLKKYYVDTGRTFTKIEELSVDNSLLWRKERIKQNISEEYAKIYVARSVNDRLLKKDYELAPYERAIQVGAILTEIRLEKNILTDHIGDHISGKNRQFCELTGLYWIWKNTGEEIIGLAHYRRHFILPKDWIERMLYYQIDAILPVPLYVSPSIEGNFKERHEGKIWDCMMQYLGRYDREMYGEAEEFFKGNLYSPCNMLIVHRQVLNELCQWLFPILFYVAECEGYKEDPYLNRYPGFISERLITLFLEKNRKKYNLIYADKNFLP